MRVDVRVRSLWLEVSFELAQANRSTFVRDCLCTLLPGTACTTRSFQMLGSAVVSGPGTASPHIYYGGSRRLHQRWEYDEGSGAGMCELAWRQHPLTGEQFFDMLRNVAGVTGVRWKKSKGSQGNGGDHYMECNQ